MANVKLSSEIAEYMTDNTGLSSGTAFGASNAHFKIMQGVIPTQGELELAVDDFRSADVLIDFPTASSVYYDPEIAQVIIRNISGVAGATGTATWWYWDADIVDTTINATRIAGTLSGIGGGGEIEGAETSVINGQTYRVGTISFSLPVSYTYT